MTVSGLSLSDGFEIQIEHENGTEKFASRNYIGNNIVYNDLIETPNRTNRILNLIQFSVSILLILSFKLNPESSTAITLIIQINMICICTILLSIFYNLYPLSNLAQKQWHHIEHIVVESLFCFKKPPPINNLKSLNPYREGCSTNHNVRNVLQTVLFGIILIQIPLMLFSLKFLPLYAIITASCILIYWHRSIIFKFTQKKLFLAQPNDTQYEEALTVLTKILKWLENSPSQPA